jgi:hypothetical protein
VRRIRVTELQFSRGHADPQCMNTMACRAVTQAGLAAATASLDDEAAWPLLLVAGWLTTAADLMHEAELAAEVLAL